MTAKKPAKKEESSSEEESEEEKPVPKKEKKGNIKFKYFIIIKAKQTKQYFGKHVCVLCNNHIQSMNERTFKLAQTSSFFPSLNLFCFYLVTVFSLCNILNNFLLCNLISVAKKESSSEESSDDEEKKPKGYNFRNNNLLLLSQIY